MRLFKKHIKTTIKSNNKQLYESGEKKENHQINGISYPNISNSLLNNKLVVLSAGGSMGMSVPEAGGLLPMDVKHHIRGPQGICESPL